MKLGQVWPEYTESVLAYLNTPNFKFEQLNIDAKHPKSDLMLIHRVLMIDW